MSALRDLTGKRFGRLVVVQRTENTKHSQSRWLCLCDCGQEKIALGSALGNCTNSCGCAHRERARSGVIGRTHGMRKTPEYGIWWTMRRRCEDPNTMAYPRYGGRGITVCMRWKKFENFIADMGRRPGPGFSIERQDNDGAYEPSNCRWATIGEQLYNKRNTRFLDYAGSKITTRAASLIAGVSPKAIRRRITDGWSVTRAIETPTNATSPSRP